MKRKLAIVLILVSLIFSSQAQRLYSIKNLEKVSKTELNLYFEKAQKLKRTGGILLITGSVVSVAGVVIASASDYDLLSGSGSESMFAAGGIMFSAGVVTAIAGLPILITGSSRVKRIIGIKNSVSNEIFFEIAPCSFHDNLVHNYQPGATLRIRF